MLVAGALNSGKIQHLMHRFFGLNDGGMRRVHDVGIGGNQFAAAVRCVAIFHAEILHAQAADGRDHPAILIAMIVDAADLADIPADSEHFKQLAFVDQIPRVVAIGVEKVGSKRLRANSFRSVNSKTRGMVKSFSGMA